MVTLLLSNENDLAISLSKSRPDIFNKQLIDFADRQLKENVLHPEFSVFIMNYSNQVAERLDGVSQGGSPVSASS